MDLLLPVVQAIIFSNNKLKRFITAKITTTKNHTSGIALGGIGSGSVELLPDGEFHYWLIANQPRLTKRSN